eukprot:6505534-Pyramimonas_sp.AAC.2
MAKSAPRHRGSSSRSYETLGLSQHSCRRRGGVAPKRGIGSHPPGKVHEMMHLLSLASGKTANTSAQRRPPS